MSDMEWEDTGPVLLRSSSARYCGAGVVEPELEQELEQEFISFDGGGRPVENSEGVDGKRKVAPRDQPDDDEGPRKRRRQSSSSSATVRVVYRNLSRVSRRKLQSLLKEWAEWSGHEASWEVECEENGEEVYYPPLGVGDSTRVSVEVLGRLGPPCVWDKRRPLVPVWIDRPLVKRGTEEALGGVSLTSSKEREAEIPLYDRVCNPVPSQDSPDRPECAPVITREAPRCFNCNAYSHALKDCPRPLDFAVINNARKQRCATSAARPTVRYFNEAAGGKFEGLKPGILGKETRESLGIGEWDPPPWLNRMREIGYPPGYLEIDDEDEPSGIDIIEGDPFKPAESPEEGEICEGPPPMPANLDADHICVSPITRWSVTKRMVVEYPGVNAPVPMQANQRLWKAPSTLHISGNQRSVPASLLLQSDGTSPPGLPPPDVTPPGFDTFSRTLHSFSPPPTRDYSPGAQLPSSGFSVGVSFPLDSHRSRSARYTGDRSGTPTRDSDRGSRSRLSYHTYTSR